MRRRIRALYVWSVFLMLSGCGQSGSNKNPGAALGGSGTSGAFASGTGGAGTGATGVGSPSSVAGTAGPGASIGGSGTMDAGSSGSLSTGATATEGGSVGTEASAAVSSSGLGGAVGTTGSSVGGMAGAEASGTDGIAGSAGSAGTSGTCGTPVTLKEAGACTGRRVGVALSAQHLTEAAYAQRALEFNYVTPENEMKWDVTEPSPGQFTFEQGDAIVDFAMANGMAVKGHTLLWHNQLPSWLTNLQSESEVRAAMLRHIQGLVEYYRGKVVAWDVVNEAFDDSGVLRNSIFNQYLGRSFIEEAFVAARAADPDAKLYYNDYDIESLYDKTEAVYEMVADLKARGIPIDGVGMQMHTRTTEEDPPVSEFIVVLERFLALGVEVVISEMDVRFCAGGTPAEQQRRYHDLVAACVARPGCSDVTIWGITDKYSFLNERTDLACAGSEQPRPLLWDDDYNQKPAYDGLLRALATLPEN